MNRRVWWYSMVLLTGVASVHAINITGKVTNNSGSAIRNAIVSLVTNELKDTTDRNGNFTLTDGVVGVIPKQMVPSVEALTMKKGMVHLSITEKTPVKLELFDLRGNLIRRIINHTLPAGSYRYVIASNPFARQILAVRVKVGQHSTTFRYLPLGNGYATAFKGHGTAAGELNTLAKIQATVDSIRVEATGYTTKSVAVETLEGEVNITLDTMQQIQNLDKFSFFVTSLAALQDLSGSENGFGGDLRFGHTGPGAGLKGADSICECIA
ncbi:MAG: carboxypeptidase regulatory-like domain-containing protein, partial [Chitinispirillaceae bacterium]|nr:carboxypeptidase regulatory-like domain-containing protein [Chitinispirillaceae bacterium]